MTESGYQPSWRQRWSIGMYTGPSPLALSPASGIPQPVLTAEHVTDVRAGMVADPFLLHRDGCWHLFFELWNSDAARGEIGHAVSDDGMTWHYRQVVLREPFHLSYPFVVASQGEVWMIPETRQAESVRLYRADPFPSRWTLVRSLVHGRFADTTLVRHEGLWWMFTQRGLDELRLFYCPDIAGDWQAHARSPLIAGNRRITRPGGRIVRMGSRLLRVAQDGLPSYGYSLRVLEIDRLSPVEYAEHELPASPVLEATGEGWNGMGMHHMDAQALPEGGWLAAVDGTTLGFY